VPAGIKVKKAGGPAKFPFPDNKTHFFVLQYGQVAGSNSPKAKIMFFREAKSQDIEKMHAVQMAVEEDKAAPLPGPQDYRQLLAKGKGWVCEVDGDILGFALADLPEARVCALLVLPGLEGDFISRMLHDLMTSWCFARGVPRLTLSTTPNTRAEQFYLKAGWVKTGIADNGKIHLELENNLEPLDY
jgi:GNAT superfamily N-acetyltransferase